MSTKLLIGIVLVALGLAALPRAAAGAIGQDVLEDNYDPDHAAEVAIGTIYALNFVCPSFRLPACPGGDHDYLKVPLKAETDYVIATFNLTDTDTVLDLYWGDLKHPAVSDDDAYAQDAALHAPGGPASVLRWRAPNDGWAIVRVAPRLGKDAAPTGSYQFAIALAYSPLAEQIERWLRQQAGMPAQTPTPPASPLPVSTPMPVSTPTTEGNGQPPLAGTPSVTLRSTPLPSVTPSPNSTPTLDLTPQPIMAEVAELPALVTPSPTLLPRLQVSLTIRVGYDRNQNKAMDVDEGVRGLAVYVSDGAGRLLGQGRTDVDGAAAIVVQVAPNAELAITVPYFAAVQHTGAARPETPPILINGTAQLPALLP